MTSQPSMCGVVLQKEKVKNLWWFSCNQIFCHCGNTMSDSFFLVGTWLWSGSLLSVLYTARWCYKTGSFLVKPSLYTVN